MPPVKDRLESAALMQDGEFLEPLLLGQLIPDQAEAGKNPTVVGLPALNLDLDHIDHLLDGQIWVFLKLSLEPDCRLACFEFGPKLLHPLEKKLDDVLALHHDFVTFRLSVQRVRLVTLSTLKRRVSPAEMDVVQPVSVLLCPLVAVEIVGLADAVMLSPTTGG